MGKNLAFGSPWKNICVPPGCNIFVFKSLQIQMSLLKSWFSIGHAGIYLLDAEMDLKSRMLSVCFCFFCTIWEVPETVRASSHQKGHEDAQFNVFRSAKGTRVSFDPLAHVQMGLGPVSATADSLFLITNIILCSPLLDKDSSIGQFL